MILSCPGLNGWHVLFQIEALWKKHLFHADITIVWGLQLY